MAAMLTPLTALRDKALAALRNSTEYAEFAALDEAVFKLGGKPARLMTEREGAWIGGVIAQVADGEVRANIPNRRISHANAAEAALAKHRRPLMAGELMAFAIEEGATISGEKPLVNFTSSLSKDKRFYSFRNNNGYYWWLAGKPEPASLSEPVGLNFEEEPTGSSMHTNQGGATNATTT